MATSLDVSVDDKVAKLLALVAQKSDDRTTELPTFTVPFNRPTRFCVRESSLFVLERGYGVPTEINSLSWMARKRVDSRLGAQEVRLCRALSRASACAINTNLSQWLGSEERLREPPPPSMRFPTCVVHRQQQAPHERLLRKVYNNTLHPATQPPSRQVSQSYF